jgi:hypothetical protein
MTPGTMPGQRALLGPRRGAPPTGVSSRVSPSRRRMHPPSVARTHPSPTCCVCCRRTPSGGIFLPKARPGGRVVRPMPPCSSDLLRERPCKCRVQEDCKYRLNTVNRVPYHPLAVKRHLCTSYRITFLAGTRSCSLIVRVDLFQRFLFACFVSYNFVFASLSDAGYG